MQTNCDGRSNSEAFMPKAKGRLFSCAENSLIMAMTASCVRICLHTIKISAMGLIGLMIKRDDDAVFVTCPCSAEPKSNGAVYFEAWKIKLAFGKITDKATGIAVNDTCGYYSQSTEIRIFCGTKKITDAINKWKTNATYGKDNCKTGTGGLPSHGEKPPLTWWNDSQKVGGREFKVDWECCNKCDKKTICYVKASCSK